MSFPFKPVQSMHIIDGTVFRCKHVSLSGEYLFFQADGIAKLPQDVLWCFTAYNRRPVKPLFWYEDDAAFKENHLTVYVD